MRVAVATQFAVGRSALAVARFATRRHHASPGTTAATGAGDARRDAGTDRDGTEEESAIRSVPGNVADASTATTDAAFDAFLETCVPLGHPPHE